MLPVVRRGILGGTFDPIHIAHLAAAEAAYRSLGLDVVTFIPTGRPWQKTDRSVSAPEHRLAMVEAATAGIDYFTVDDREVKRDGYTYTIDTLEELGDDTITLILGADAAANLPTWHRSAEVLARADIAVVPRPGTGAAAVEEVGARLTWLALPEIDVSGTQLRAMRHSGASIRFLVPEAVYAYVEQHDLYV